MTIKVDPRRLWCDLKAKLAKKPPETCSAATQDEYFVEIQNGFLQLITFFPLYAVENMVELEMWNVLYKTQINSLQSLLHRRLPFSGNSGSFKYSTMELKLRLVLLLDRASGVYFNLIYQLLQPISEQTWPKVILGILANFDAVLDLDNNRVEHVSDFLDLDLATFSSNRAFSRKIKYPELKSSLTTYESETSVITPRILSRGDRLPSEIETITSNVENCKISDETGKSVDKLVDEDEKESSKVNTNQNSDFHYLDQEAAVIYLVHHCLVHLGDIARYRQQPNVAAGYYLWAWVVHPDSGHSFNQLAILEATKPLPRRCIDALFYYYIRALSCLHSFPAAMNNLSNVLADYYKSSELSTCDDNNVEINTGLAKDVVSSSKRWPQFNNIQMKSLIQFYAALQLHTDPRKLMLIADDLFETMDNWGTIELSKIQLLRILCIHFCLTDQYLSDAKSNLSSFQTIDKQPSILHNKYQTGTILLLCLTVRLINWMASSSVIASSPNEHVSNGSNVKPVITHVSNDNYNHDDDNNNNDPANKNENSFLISSTTNVYPTLIGNKMNEVAYQSESIFALNLLFLWFRSSRFYEIINAETKLSYELTDSLFKLLTPAFTENTVCILNNLLKHYRPLLHNLNSSENKQPTDIPVAVSHNSDDKNGNVHSKTIDDIIVKEEQSENPSFLNNHIDDAFHKHNDHGNESINTSVTPIDWVRLMKLPETVILQGFQPLHIPTQRSLCSSSSVAYNPVNPFLLDFYHYKLNELIISKCPSQHQNNASQPQFEIETERILCLLTSARYIAEVFPSLVNWIPNSNGVENFDSTETLMWSGSFYCNSHSSYSLKDMFSLLSISTNITSSSNKETQSVNLEESISPKSNSAYPNVMSNNDHQLNCEHKTVTQLTKQKSEIAVTIENPNLSELISTIPVTTTQHETIKPNNLMNDETEKLLLSSQVTSTSSDSVAISSTVSSSSLPSSLLPHVGTSGGLIMNAELAKFIQEQASQVAARQQRFNISSNPINNDSQQQLTPVGAPMPSNICGSLSSGEGETSLSSRLSATFKRNLPPRYAKLLQAELQENEALKNRHNHHQIQKEVNSPLLSLDQPAPLARKESEAPIDLISLLSSSDVNTVALHHELQQRNMHQPQWF